MTPARTPRGLGRGLISTMLLVGLLATALPATAVTAQTDSLDAARAFLGGVPGLKVEQLSIHSDAIGDAEPGADVAWAASGEIQFTNKLRKWLKPLVESGSGWGRLPARDVQLLVTFVKMDQAPTKDGDATAVIHLGLAGEDSLLKAGLQLDPGNGARLVHSFGLWQGDGQFFTQNGTSPVTVGGVSWFGDAAKGAGGIVLPEGVIVNVVPIPKWAKRFRIQSESVKPFSSAPNAPSRDIVFGLGGSEWIRRDGVPAERVADCFSTFVSPLANGSRQVEINLQTAAQLDAKTLAENLKLAGYDANGEMHGTLDASWTSFPGRGLHRGLVEVVDPAVTEVGVYGAEAVAGTINVITKANSGARISLEGSGIASGQSGCGRVVAADLDVCDSSVTNEIAEVTNLPGIKLDITPVVTPDGSMHCQISFAGEPLARVIVGAQPVTQGNIAEIAEASGCTTTPMEAPRAGSLVECDEFAAMLWRLAIPAARLAPFDGGLGIVQTLLLYQPLPQAPASDEFDPEQPVPMEDGAPLAASLEGAMDALDDLVGESEFRLAVPGGGLPA